MENISELYSKLIALNCLDGAEGSRIRALWAERFHERAAFWVDVTPGQSAEEIFDRLREEIARQNIHTMNNESCIVATFIDLTKPADPNLLEALAMVPRQMNTLLKCRVSLVYEFAYLGMMTLSARKELQERVGALCARNQQTQNLTIRRQICLVAKPPLAGGSVNYWKAAVVCLDILRRKSSPAEALPSCGTGGTNDDVGFLRYGEFDDERLRQVTDRKAELEKLLGSGGRKELQERVDALLRKLDNAITQGVRFDPLCQPIHPHMMVEGFFKRKSARKGKNKEFNEARLVTQDAIRATGEEIKGRALSLARIMVGDRDTLLRSLMDDAGVGLELEMDADTIRRCLNTELRRVDIPAPPVLEYNEDGYTQEIRVYFSEMLEHGRYLAKKYVTEELLAAYTAISPEDMKTRGGLLRQALDMVRHELTQIPKEADFCASAKGPGNMLETGFTPALAGGGTRRYLLCRTPETAQRLDKSYGSTDLAVCLIHGAVAGLKTQDGAPVKALHILSFDCDKARLRDLIPEVG